MWSTVDKIVTRIFCGATNVRSGCGAPTRRDKHRFASPRVWMTNSLKVAKALDRRCSGGHRHCNLFSAGAHKMRVVERYPVRLVNAVLRALRQDVKERCQKRAMEAGHHVDEPDVWLRNPEYFEEVNDATLARNWTRLWSQRRGTLI